MSISKRLRYEVLRRDNHTCQYCGAKAPEAWLDVDHVFPQSLGGSDEPSNLVAACKDCNAGKGANLPNADFVPQVPIDALRWKRAVEEVSWQLQIQDSHRNDYTNYFDGLWRNWWIKRANPEDEKIAIPRPVDWAEQLEKLRLAGLPAWMWDNFVKEAMNACEPLEKVFSTCITLGKRAADDLLRRAQRWYNEDQEQLDDIAQTAAVHFCGSWKPSTEQWAAFDKQVRHAIAMGHKADDINDAAAEAGAFKDTCLNRYLPSPWPKEAQAVAN